MKIIRIETTLVPSTIEGKKFAKDYARRLQKQNALCGYEEDTKNISITARYYFELKEE